MKSDIRCSSLNWCVIIFTLASTAVISSCATTTKESNLVQEDEGLPIHGRFCGPGVPSTDGITKTEHQIKYLKNMQPIDLVDLSCKQHDICYAEHDYFDRGCDRSLRKNLEILSKAFGIDSRCGILVNYLVGYFRISNVGWVTEEVWFHENHNWFNKIILTPFALIGEVFSAVKTFGLAARDTTLSVIPGTLPARDEVCGDIKYSELLDN